MSADLDGFTVAMLGGDKRELELLQALRLAGARIKAVGYPSLPQLAEDPGTRLVDTLEEAVTGADAIIAPMSNTDETGKIKAVMDNRAGLKLSGELFEIIPPGTPLLIGMAKPVVKEWAARRGLRLVETAEIEEVAVLNSIPTAEGAIQIAMQELPITIHGSNSFVLGFGRCGVTLARTLKALGANTTVLARNPAQLARALEMGCVPVPLAELAGVVGQAEIIFNTVPALLLTREILKQARPDLLIVDIASAPGGVDFTAAREMGIKAVLALGLPGQVAPKTAGQILARALPKIIANMLRD
ncbi:MAG: dipicolinate synthase subunit DpsA [Syntrophothermus sp.]